jgi:hypothetical protein
MTKDEAKRGAKHKAKDVLRRNMAWKLIKLA